MAMQILILNIKLIVTEYSSVFLISVKYHLNGAAN